MVSRKGRWIRILWQGRRGLNQEVVVVGSISTTLRLRNGCMPTSNRIIILLLLLLFLLASLISPPSYRTLLATPSSQPGTPTRAEWVIPPCCCVTPLSIFRLRCGGGVVAAAFHGHLASQYTAIPNMLASGLRCRVGLLRRGGGGGGVNASSSSTSTRAVVVVLARGGLRPSSRNLRVLPLLQHLPIDHPQQHRGFVAAAATSSQKRALNPDQLQGAAATPPPPPPPSGGGTRPGTAPPSSSSPGSPTTNLWSIGAALGGTAVVGGLAFYAMRPSSEPSSVAATPVGKPATTAKVPPATRPSPPTPAPAAKLPEYAPGAQASSAPPLAATSEPPTQAAAPTTTGPHRVTTIQVPPKMRGGSTTNATPLPPSTNHPEDGHRVGVAMWKDLVPPATSTSSAAEPPPIEELDATVTHRALAMLQPPETNVPSWPLQNEARDSVVASHQSLWNSMTTAPGGALHDLESLDVGQLKQRIIRLATELQDRTQWEAIRLKEFLALQERTAAERYVCVCVCLGERVVRCGRC